MAILDPLYLALLSPETASGASNVFLMGAMLQGLTKLGQETGCTIVLLHHFRKGGQPDEENPAGLGRVGTMRALPSGPGNGFSCSGGLPTRATADTCLWMRCGGSAGHSSLWGVTIDEGQLDPDTFTGRTWEVTVAPVADARAEAKAEQENRKAAEQEKREGEHRDRLLTVLRTMPEGDTARALRVAARIERRCFRPGCLLSVTGGPGGKVPSSQERSEI